MSRRIDEKSGPKYSRVVPAGRKTAHTEGLPAVGNCAGFTGLCDVLLRCRVYLGVWAGRDGNIVFLDVRDGDTFRRYGCISDAELSRVVAALYQEYDGS